MTGASELSVLVATEQRLDAAVAQARVDGEAVREAARAKVGEATAAIEQQIERERALGAQRIAAEVATRERAIEQAAIAAIARYQAVQGDVLDRIAGALAARVIAIALEAP